MSAYTEKSAVSVKMLTLSESVNVEDKLGFLTKMLCSVWLVHLSSESVKY